MTKILPVVFAEVAILILGVAALEYGMNGAIFASCIAALAGLGGFHLRQASKL